LDEDLPKKIKDFPGSCNLMHASKARNLHPCLFKAFALQLTLSGVLVLKDDGSSMDMNVFSNLNPDPARRLHCCREENDAAWDGTHLLQISS
jgi:hypothetical protein